MSPVNDFISEGGDHLLCPYCGAENRADMWPSMGGFVPYVIQVQPGPFYLTVNCHACQRAWCVAWNADPGPMAARTDAARARLAAAQERVVSSPSPANEDPNPEAVWCRCPGCARVRPAPTSFMGRRVRCDDCGERFVARPIQPATIQIVCPRCVTSHPASETCLGKRVCCATCGCRFVAPAAGADPPRTEASPAAQAEPPAEAESLPSEDYLLVVDEDSDPESDAPGEK